MNTVPPFNRSTQRSRRGGRTLDQIRADKPEVTPAPRVTIPQQCDHSDRAPVSIGRVRLAPTVLTALSWLTEQDHRNMPERVPSEFQPSQTNARRDTMSDTDTCACGTCESDYRDEVRQAARAERYATEERADGMARAHSQGMHHDRAWYARNGCVVCLTEFAQHGA